MAPWDCEATAHRAVWHEAAQGPTTARVESVHPAGKVVIEVT